MYIVMVAVCISITWLCYKLFLENRTVVNAIRWYFLFSIVVSLTIPLCTISISLPARDTVTGMTGNIPTRVDNNTYTIITESPVDYTLYIYCSIALVLLARTAVQFYKIYACYKRSKKESRDGVCIVWNTQFKNPFSFFKLIFLNKNHITTADMDKVLAHERVHVLQYHSVDIVLMEFLKALLWFNPFVWMMRQSMQLVHEYLADEGVLQSGIDKVQYQQLLLDHIIENNVVSVSSALNQSLIKKRFLMMSAKKSNPVTKYKIFYIAPVAVLLLLGVGFINGNSNVAAAVAPTNTNVLYIGIRNQVTISVPGYKPDEVQVITDNGSIAGSNGQYVIEPVWDRYAFITVMAKGKVVSELVFRVKHLPFPLEGFSRPWFFTMRKLVNKGC